MKRTKTGGFSHILYAIGAKAPIQVRV